MAISTKRSSDLVSLNHKRNPDIQINRDALQIYLNDYKNAIEFGKKENMVIILVKTSFVLSFFFTSDFKSFFTIPSGNIKIMFAVLAGIYIYNEFKNSLFKNLSKHSQTDPEEMVKIIENNCDKK